MKALLVVLVAALCVAGASARSYALDEPQDIYPGCFCVVEWNDDNRVGDWLVADNWLQLEEPHATAFVNASGDNTITLRETRQVNNLLLGENRWDTTRLVLEGDLIISYDDQPEIASVSAVKEVTGTILLEIQGKGFGFDSDSISVEVTELLEDDSAVLDNDGNTYTVTYECEEPTLKYRDAKIDCTIAPIRAMPYQMSVVVHANGKTSQPMQVARFAQ